ncbi:IS3 family transposase, partial [Sulfurimonas sp. SAG-AH-194-I05]|nr:IS3 family transposase [Sulfurimonas sp. SAG-AH-194-I05]
MTSVVVRTEILELVDEAKVKGASMLKISPIIGFSARTLQRWSKTSTNEDKRTIRIHKAPPNKLTQEEKESLVTTANTQEYKNLSPHQIVP